MNLLLDSVDEENAIVRMSVAGIVSDTDVKSSSDPLAHLPVAELHRQRVLLNLKPVERLNSNGVGWLLRFHKECQEAGGRLVLHSLPQLAMNVIKVMRLHEVLVLAKDESHAMQMLGETSS